MSDTVNTGPASDERGGGGGDCHHVLEDTAHHASDRDAMTVN